MLNKQWMYSDRALTYITHSLTHRHAEEQVWLSPEL